MEYTARWPMEMRRFSVSSIRYEPHTPPVIAATSIAQELENISKLLDLSEGIGMAADTLEKMGFILSPTQPITPGDGKFTLFTNMVYYGPFWSILSPFIGLIFMTVL